MARRARAVIPDVPHHVTQRGNRRQPTFFCDDDYGLYRDLIAESCRAVGVGLAGLLDSALPQADHEAIRRGASRSGRNRYSVP